MRLYSFVLKVTSKNVRFKISVLVHNCAVETIEEFK